MTTLKNLDPGQFLYIKSPAGYYYISIFKGIEVRNNADTRDIELHTYCDLCSDDNYVYFAKESSTLLETVSNFAEIGTATEEQKKLLYNAIIKKYKDNHPTWDKYFTDSVMFFLQDPDPKVNQVMISYITGAILPIVSLCMTSMVVGVAGLDNKEEIITDSEPIISEPEVEDEKINSKIIY